MSLRSGGNKIVQMMHAAFLCELSQAFVVGGEVTAQQSRLLKKRLNPMAPDFGAGSQSIQNRRDLATDAGLSLAAEAAGVVDQQQLAAQ